MAPARAHLLASLLAFGLVFAVAPLAADLTDDLIILWGGQKLTDSTGRQIFALTLNQTMGSAFRSKRPYLFQRIDMDIKLVPKNSAGTVTTLYMISEGAWNRRDEIDIEFLGNVTGEPYTMHTNLYTDGVGGKEKQYRLWFDPTADFHTYSIVWNPQEILILVDNTVIRQFKNHRRDGIAFPLYQPMNVYGCIWNADDWATMGGQVKTDWSQQPFTAYFKNYKANACVPTASSSFDCSGQASYGGGWYNQGNGVEEMKQKQLQDVDAKYKIYDYCEDSKRFPNGNYPRECGLQ